MKASIHEDLSRVHDIRGSSDRTFGLVLGVFFLGVGLWPMRSARPVRLWPVVISAIFLILSFLRPSLLHFLNQWWIRLGLLLGKIVNPIVTGLLFYLVFTPAGLMLRLLGKDPLHLKFEPGSQSYWIERTPPGPPPETMAHQF
jgi:hypothetical protein